MSDPLAGVFTESRLQLTNTNDLLALNRHYLAANEGRDAVVSADLDPSTKLVGLVRIDEGVILGATCTVGPNVSIEANACIGNNVAISDSIVLRGVSIANGCEIHGQVLS